MTTPSERMRALRYGFEVLGQIMDDTAIPEGFQNRARSLRLAYPSSLQVEHLIDGRSAGLPADWGVIFEMTLTLITEIQLSKCGSDETQTKLRYTLRHYPDRSLISFLTQIRSVDGWLSRER
jgi:hypothetical protein